jgi:hypothetical protein
LKLKYVEFTYLEGQDMAKVILTAQVQDGVKWEDGFRTHGELFRAYTLEAPIRYTISGNEIVICMEPRDLDAFKRSMESPATAAAMAFDGVKRETVKMFVLDKDLKV